MMLNGLYLFGFLGSRYRETIPLFQHTLDQSACRRAAARAGCSRVGGAICIGGIRPDYQEALTHIEQALTIARAENNQFEIAFCQLMAAYAMMSMQRYADALPHLETSQALFEAIDEPYYVCWALHRLGYVYSNLNDPDKANRIYGTELGTRTRAPIIGSRWSSACITSAQTTFWTATT